MEETAEESEQEKAVEIPAEINDSPVKTASPFDVLNEKLDKLLAAQGLKEDK